MELVGIIVIGFMLAWFDIKVVEYCVQHDISSITTVILILLVDFVMAFIYGYLIIGG